MACEVPNCRSYFNSAKRSGENISFHRFPVDIKDRNKWIQAIGRSNWSPTKHSRVCSKHFQEKDFILAGNIKHLLKKSVPSINVSKILNKPQERQIVTPNHEGNVNLLSDPLDIKVEIDFEDMITKLQPIPPSIRNIAEMKETVRKKEINYQEGLIKKDRIIRGMSSEIFQLKSLLRDSESKLQRTDKVSKNRFKIIQRLRKRDQRYATKIKKMEEVIGVLCDDQNVNEADLMNVVNSQEHVC